MAKKKGDPERTEDRYRKMQHKVKVEIAKTKQRANEDLYDMLGTKKAEVEL